MIFCLNDNPWLILTYFTTRPNFATYAFTKTENVTKMHILEILPSLGRNLVNSVN